jgi:hypothetical protein
VCFITCISGVRLSDARRQKGKLKNGKQKIVFGKSDMKIIGYKNREIDLNIYISDVYKVMTDGVFNQFNLRFQIKFLHNMVFVRFNCANANK